MRIMLRLNLSLSSYCRLMACNWHQVLGLNYFFQDLSLRRYVIDNNLCWQIVKPNVYTHLIIPNLRQITLVLFTRLRVILSDNVTRLFCSTGQWHVYLLVIVCGHVCVCVCLRSVKLGKYVHKKLHPINLKRIQAIDKSNKWLITNNNDKH